MEEWKEYKIEDLIEEISMGPFGSNIKVCNFIDYGIPVLNGSNIQGFKLNEDKFNYVSEEKADSLGKANAYRGDVVITHRGTLGQIVFIPSDSKFERYVISQSQFRVKLKKDKVREDFFTYFFHTRLGQYKLLSNASQVGVPALARPTSTFKELKISLPSINYQNKVMEILSSLDEKIEINHKITENLEQQAQALFKSWFVDFEPFKDGKFVDSELGIIPEGWEVDTINNVANIIAGGDKPKKFSKEKTPEFSVPIYSNGIDNEGLYGYTDTARIYDSSITISARGTIGFVCLRKQPYLPIVRLISIIPNIDYVSAEYLYLWASNKHIEGNGTTQQQLTVPNFKNTEIVLPSKKVCQSFNEIVISIFNKISFLKKENEHLISLRDTLLPKLMSGEIEL